MTLIVKTIQAMRNWTAACRRAGESIGFVPTMGALHEGHLALIRASREQMKRTVVSIFINPTQFGPHEDFDAYPRIVEKDLALLKKTGCDLLFLPDVSEMYPRGAQSLVRVKELSQDLCGISRPGHFQGVTTVVAILLNSVQPDTLFVGLKDYQQWIVIRRMVRDLHFPVTVTAVPTVRESDGLALSSRNCYLSVLARRRAGIIYQALLAAREAFRAGELNAAHLEEVARRRLLHSMHLSGEVGDAQVKMKIEYVAVRHAETLEPVSSVLWRHKDTENLVLLVAVRVDGTRLIDNMIL